MNFYHVCSVRARVALPATSTIRRVFDRIMAELSPKSKLQAQSGA
jgi:hypothetical protein